MPKRGHYSRSRSLEKFNSKFGKNIVQDTIKEFILKNKNVRVLEIGAGEGRVLMQIRKLFPYIELYGINKKPWPAMKGSSSLKRTGTYYKIFRESEIKKVKLPKIEFYNARHLNFKDDFLDLIISQVSIQYIDRKDLLIEDIWRCLKIGGKAFLHIDTTQKPIPDFLNNETPRFLIYKNNKVLTVRNLVKELQSKGYDIKYKDYTETEENIVKTRILLIINKNTAKPLKLNLKFEKLSSFDLSLINKDKDSSSIFWGYRSVFNKK